MHTHLIIEKGEDMEFKLNYLGLIALVGILIGLVGFFLVWVDFGGMDDTGLDHLLSMDGAYAVSALLLFIGLLVSLIMIALEFMGLGTKFSLIVLAVTGVVMIISSMSVFVDADRYAGTGVFFMIAASVLIFLSALLMLFVPCCCSKKA